MTNNNDEIEIGAVFSKIGSFFSRIKNKLFYYIQIIRKRIVLLLTVSIVGLILGGVKYMNTKPVYKATMVLTSKTLSNQYCKYLIENLIEIKNGDIDSFSKKLNINTETGEGIAGIEYAKFDEKLKISPDSLTFSIPFKIILSTYNPSIIDTVGSSVINYLENNEYALKRKNTDLIFTQNLIKKLRSEITNLDTLKSIIAKNIAVKEKTSGIVIGNQIDPMGAYREGINLYRQELYLNGNLLIPESIYVISRAVAKKTPDEPVLLTNLLSGLLLGLIVGSLIVLGLEK